MLISEMIKLHDEWGIYTNVNVLQLGYDHHLRYEPCSGFLGRCTACLYYKEKIELVKILERMEFHICSLIFKK